MRTIAPIVVLALWATACSHRVGDLTMVSSRNVSGIAPRPGSARVSESDCAYHVLGFISVGEPDIEDALDEALDAAKAQALVDVVIWHRDWTIPLIWGDTCYTVEGSPAVFGTPTQPMGSPVRSTTP